MQLPSPQQLFQGKYRIHQVIGKGGFATVYRATDEEVGRDVALKILSPGPDGTYPEAVVARFLREAQLLAELQDPHTITMYDFGRADNGLLYMVSEYVSGIDLQEVLRRRQTLGAREVRHIVKQMLFALREAHDAGIFHRDIKPPNILIYEYMGDPWRAKLLDFGVAKPIHSHPLGPQNLTREGAMVGTPRYMAPEQIYGRELTAAADLYSLGLVAFELLTGRPAIDAKSNKDRVKQQLSGPQVQLTEDYGDPVLQAVVNRLILRPVEARFGSANEALQALRGRTANVAPPDPPTRAWATRTRPAVIVAAGALVACIVGLAVAYAVLSRKPAPRPSNLQAVLKTSEAPTPKSPRQEVTQQAEVARPERPVEIAHGCTRTPPEPGYSWFETMWEYRPRRWLAYVPKNFDPTRRYPVILAFHNYLNEPRDFLNMTRLPQIADAEGFILIAPAQNMLEENTLAIESIVEDAESHLCIDRGAIYALGHGRGAFFALRLACDMPLAAVAVTGASERTGERICRANEPVPTLRFYGTRDPLVPYQGGVSCLGASYVSRAEIERGHVANYGCTKDREAWFEYKNSTCRSWTCDDARYVSCELDGGHGWPGGAGTFTLPTCASDPADFPLQETVWKFFRDEGKVSK